LVNFVSLMVALLVHIASACRTALRYALPSLFHPLSATTKAITLPSDQSRQLTTSSTSSTPPKPQIKHPWACFPLPPVLHQVLDNQFISKFDEILVIGDVHGCYDEMVQMIEIADIGQNGKNNAQKILKLLVGDLVNKGPKNQQVVQFMMNNAQNCLSVRGNHDELVINEYHKWHKCDDLGFTTNEKHIREGNEWMLQFSKEEMNYLVSLPYTIRIPSLSAIIVHAGLCPGVELENQAIHDMMTMRNVTEKDGVFVASQRATDGYAWASKWNGPDHVYFGHDAKRKLQKHAFATGLDSGCVYGNALTAIFIMGPRKGQFISLSAAKVYQKPKGND
jgi:bis(5'-nucleosyl)-tetraphosphatase (symmetrical)